MGGTIYWDQGIEVVTPRNKSDRGSDAAECANGKVLYGYPSGGAWIEGYAPSVGVFVTENYSVDVTTLTTSFNMGGYMDGMYSRIDGVLYLTITSNSPTSGFLCRVYRSPSGNGKDWVTHGTIRTGPYGPFQYEGMSARIEKMPSGRWVACHLYTWEGTVDGSRYMWSTSDDGGITWTNRETKGFGPVGGPYHSAYSGSMAQWKGRLWSMVGSDYAGAWQFIRYSEDEGETWTWAFGSNNLQYVGYPSETSFAYVYDGTIWTDGNHLYVAQSAQGQHVLRTDAEIPSTQPNEAGSEWEEVGDGHSSWRQDIDNQSMGSISSMGVLDDLTLGRWVYYHGYGGWAFAARDRGLPPVPVAGQATRKPTLYV